MKRPSKDFLEAICACPDCGGDLALSESDRICMQCSSQSQNYKAAPVMLPAENLLFNDSDYVETDSDRLDFSAQKSGRKIVKILKKYMPSKSVNLARERIFSELAKRLGDRPLSLLVVGCGKQTEQLKKYFDNSNITFVFCDIDKRADVDIFCDAHRLPFKDESFDGLITTAVLEHVLYPEKAVSEMVRVLKLGGFIYSEIPFLQSVHEGAYDFTRYTMSGHRRLLERFDEIEAGMVAGPATALVWSLCDFSKTLFKTKALSQLLSMLTQYSFFWIKYFDLLIERNARALDFASCTCFWGEKISETVTPESIVDKYGNRVFQHV